MARAESLSLRPSPPASRSAPGRAKDAAAWGPGPTPVSTCCTRLPRSLALLGLLASAGCATIPPAPPVTPTQYDARLFAGVASQDITPPPGLSLFGHGPEGRVSVGALLRLRCSAFVFTQGREAVALVPCDLAAASLELQREVAARVAKDVPLGAAQIFLMASHTHAGPAHYFGARQFHDSGFSSREPGFDEKVLGFLADKIAEAIIAAYKNRGEAVVSWQLATTGVHGGAGLTRNRSYPAFAQNRSWPGEVDPAMGVARSAEDACRVDLMKRQDARLTPAERAVPRAISVLRVDHVVGEGKTAPAGLFAVFGVHNTGIPNTNDLYHADVFGFASRYLEEQLAVRACELQRPPHLDCDTAWRSFLPGSPVVVGIANGIEGDVSPAVDFQAPREARRIGNKLGERILRLWDAGAGDLRGAKLRRAYREVELSGAPVEGGERLAENPALGSAAAGGAEDGPTRLRVFPAMNEGVRSDAERPPHGWKLPLTGVTGPFVAGRDFPNVAPLGLVRIGDHTLATVPFELTTVAGLRLRDGLDGVLGAGNAVMVGLTNSYLSYVATKDEYALQHYEGASTLYGPHTARFLGTHLGCLAGWMESGKLAPACLDGQPLGVDGLSPAPYWPVNVSRFPVDPEALPPRPPEPVELTHQVYRRDNEWGIEVRLSGIPGSALAQRGRFAVEIRAAQDDQLLDDDRGSGMELRLDDTRSDGRWIIRWVPGYRRGHKLCGRNVRLVVRDTRPFAVSSPFAVQCEAHPPTEEGWLSPAPPPPPGCP